MTSNYLRVVRTFIAVGCALVAVASACGGETDASGGSSETNFQHCETDADCSQGKRCVAEVCSAVGDAGSAVGDAQVDAGLVCTLDTTTCSDSSSCAPTWTEESALYPAVCPTGVGSAIPYQAVCGEYNALITGGPDTLTTSYYDRASGALVGLSWWVSGATGCTAMVPEFTLPPNAFDPPIACTPLPGVDCSAMNTDAGHDAGDDGPVDSGLGCTPGTQSDCMNETTCSWTWAQASTRYPETCPVLGQPHQAVCGPYNAIIDQGVDTNTTYYYDPSSGALLGSSWFGSIMSGCTAFTAGFVAPKSACTPPPGVDCNATTADAGHDASNDAARGDGGFGTPCSSDLDCTSTLKCCYPCGIPGCQNECIEPLTNGMCPMYP